MDYDLTDIPAVYDLGREHGPEVLDLWMNAMSSHLSARGIETILDLGCGTGRFSEALARHFDADVIGVDPSVKMLARAHEKRRDDGVRYARGRAESIPLPSASVDLIFASMSFHHFDDRALAARECRRVLRGGGTVFIRTGTREQIPDYPYVPFLPSSVPILDALLPTVGEVSDAFEAAGFYKAGWELITQTVAPTFAAYVVKLEAGADSVLIQLAPNELETGFEALRRHAIEVGSQAVVEPIDLFVFR